MSFKLNPFTSHINISIYKYIIELTEVEFKRSGYFLAISKPEFLIYDAIQNMRPKCTEIKKSKKFLYYNVKYKAGIYKCQDTDNNEVINYNETDILFKEIDFIELFNLHDSLRQLHAFTPTGKYSNVDFIKFLELGLSNE